MSFSLSSVRSNLMEPIPSTIDSPEIPRTPIGEVFSWMEVNKCRTEQTWCVAQLSVPNSIGSGSNEYATFLWIEFAANTATL